MTSSSSMHPTAHAPSNPGLVAPCAFFCLFPGFFFYHTLVGLGMMPAVLGGYFTIASLMLMPPLAYLCHERASAPSFRMQSIDVQFGVFLVYFFLVVGLNVAFGANTATAQAHLLSVIYFANIYLIFKFIDFAARRTMAVTAGALVLMTVVILSFSDGGSFQPGQTSAALSPEGVVTYQGFARSYVLTFVPVVCFLNNVVARLLLYVAAVIALFLNGARSELAAVLFLIPMLELFRAKTALHMLALVLVAFTLLALNPPTVFERLPESRVWELFDLSSSDSARGRGELTHQAWKTIGEHPILGSYGSYAPGQYAHNLLSAWVDLGLFGFAFIVVMLVQAVAWLVGKGWFVRVQSEQVLLAWALACMAIFLLVTAKTFNEMSLGAALGAYARCRDQARSRQKPRGSGP